MYHRIAVVSRVIRRTVLLLAAAFGPVQAENADPQGSGSGSLACDQVFRGGFESQSFDARLIARAGQDQEVAPGQDAVLDGGASMGDGALSYCWTLAAKPPTSKAVLVNQASSQPTLTTDLAGDYQVRLVIDDGARISDSDSVRVSTRTVRQLVSATAGGVVVTPDRLVTLEIPPGALDQDTEIEIRLLSSAELPAGLSAADPAAAYEFAPDGLQFNLPVTFTATVNPLIPGAPAASMQAMTIVSMNASGNEILDNVENRMQGAGMTVAGDLTHFSTLALIDLAFVNIDHDRFVFGLGGGPFTANYSATVIGSANGPVTVVTSKTGAYASAPLETSPDLSDPLLDNLAYDQDIDLNFPGVSVDSGRISGQCLRGGAAEVSVQLAVDGAFLTTVANLIRKGSTTVKLFFPVRCLVPLIAAAPIATDDAVTPPFGLASKKIFVLANDIANAGIKLDTLRIERQPNFGSLLIGADGSVSYTANQPLILFDSFRYSFKDLNGLSSNIATVFISPLGTPNEPPRANPDTATTSRDQPIDVAILANDSDPDGQLDPGSVTFDTGATQGQVSSNPDGSIRYTPAAGFVGQTSFDYTVDDDDGAASNSAQVAITVITGGTPPTANSDALTVNRDEAGDVFVLANDQGAAEPTSLVISQAPFNGVAEVMLTQNGVTKGVPGAPGSVTAFIRYTPDSGYLGNDGLAYTVSDPDGNNPSTALLDILVVDPNNQPPVALDDVAATLPNTTVNIPVAFNDSDPDTLLDLNSHRLRDAPGNGSVSGGGLGAFDYTPNPGFVGVDAFTYDIADAFGARSNEATVTVTVAPAENQSPVAADDAFTVGVNTALDVNIVGNDSDPDGQLDLNSIVITQDPASGVAVVTGGGRITYSPDSGFGGNDELFYTIADTVGAVSNTAKVTFAVRQFLGQGLDPTDNVSAATVTSVSFFGEALQDLGDGAAVGASHNSGFPDNLTLIDDYTWLFEVVNSDPAVDTELDFSTPLQDFSATYLGARFSFDGPQPGPLFNETGTNTLTVSGVAAGSFDVDAPASLRDSGGALMNLLQNYDRYNTQIVVPPDLGASHLLVRVIGAGTAPPFIGVILRIPLSEVPTDGDGNYVRALLSQTAQSVLDALGFKATGQVLIILYNQIDNSSFFDFPGSRPVPLAAGRGFTLPPDQLNPRPDVCANIMPNTLCQGGPSLRILATNGNGRIDVLDPVDGSFLRNFVGDNAPNFLVDNGWQSHQDPRTNCILVSDGGDVFSGYVHQYDTDGTEIQGRFITIDRPGGPGSQPATDPRGIAIRDGNLLVAIRGTGEIREFDTVTGAPIGVIADDLIAPNSIYVDTDGDLIVTDGGFSGTEDQLYLYPRDGSPRRILIDGAADPGGGLSTPYQISRLQDGNLGLANFGNNTIRVFQDGFPLISNLIIGNAPGSGNPYLPRGIWPLDNGTFLISANNGGGVSVFDPFNFAGGGVTNRLPGSTYRFFGTACMPE